MSLILIGKDGVSYTNNVASLNALKAWLIFNLHFNDNNIKMVCTIEKIITES